MNLIFSIIALAVLSPNSAVLPPGQFRNSVSLAWDYDTNNAPDVFKLYTSDDASKPLTNWMHALTVSGNVHDVTISNIAPQQMFFFVTASNWWGELIPSNIVGIPQPPIEVGNLRILQTP